MKEFAHTSEQRFSQLLDFYSIEWEYEPRTFVLATDGAGRVIEAFTPDFYLPGYNVYVELTMLRQKLATKKRRKVRKLQTSHPEVRVKVLNRRATLGLLAKYGKPDVSRS